MFAFLTFLAAAASSPAGLTKPSLPVFPALSVADCENPSIRQQKLEALSTDASFETVAQAYNDNWEAYIKARLAKLGLSKAEEAKLMQGVLDSQEFNAIQSENEKLLEQMGATLESLGSATGDEAACKIAAKMIAMLPAMVANAQKQWEMTDRAIEAEAKRRGISLD